MLYNQFGNITAINCTIAGPVLGIWTGAVTWPNAPDPSDWRNTRTGRDYGYNLRESSGLSDVSFGTLATISFFSLGRSSVVNQTLTSTSITGLTWESGRLNCLPTQKLLGESPPPQNYQPPGLGELATTAETSPPHGCALRITEFPDE